MPVFFSVEPQHMLGEVLPGLFFSFVALGEPLTESRVSCSNRGTLNKGLSVSSLMMSSLRVWVGWGMESFLICINLNFENKY